MCRTPHIPATLFRFFAYFNHRYLSLYCGQSLYHRIRRLPHRLAYSAIMLALVLVSLAPILAVRYALRTFTSVRQSSFTRLIAYPHVAIALSKCLRLVDKCADLFIRIEECLTELLRLVYANA